MAAKGLMTRAAGVFAAPFTATSTVLAFVVVAVKPSLAAPVWANEIRDRTIRIDASDCLYEEFGKLSKARVSSQPQPKFVVSQQPQRLER